MSSKGHNPPVPNVAKGKKGLTWDQPLGPYNTNLTFADLSMQHAYEEARRGDITAWAAYSDMLMDHDDPMGMVFAGHQNGPFGMRFCRFLGSLSRSPSMPLPRRSTRR